MGHTLDEWLTLPQGTPFLLRKTRPLGNVRRELLAEVTGHSDTGDSLFVAPYPGAPTLHAHDYGEPHTLAQMDEHDAARQVRHGVWGDQDLQVLVPNSLEMVSHQFDERGVVYRTHIDLTGPLAPWALDVDGNTATLTDLVRSTAHNVPNPSLENGTYYGADIVDYDLDVVRLHDPEHPRNLRSFKDYRGNLPAQLRKRKIPPTVHIKDHKQTGELGDNMEFGPQTQKMMFHLAAESAAIETRVRNKDPYYAPPAVDYARLAQRHMQRSELPTQLAQLPSVTNFRSAAEITLFPQEITPVRSPDLFHEWSEKHPPYTRSNLAQIAATAARFSRPDVIQNFPVRRVQGP